MEQQIKEEPALCKNCGREVDYIRVETEDKGSKWIHLSIMSIFCKKAEFDCPVERRKRNG